jgi:sugar lactone lactonase YvrE
VARQVEGRDTRSREHAARRVLSVTSRFTCVLDVQASLGECPQWSIAEQALYWVDINAPSLNRFDPATGRNTVMPMPASIGCFAFRDAGGFIVALRDGIWLARADGSLERRIAAAPFDPEYHRFNDGRCDRNGRFFAGTMNERRDASTAELLRIDPDFSVTRILADITISNGLAWGPDGQTMYHADTATRSVRAFTYDIATGTPSHPQVFAEWDGPTDRPDGATVDRDGNYWVAFYRGGKVLQIAPSGITLAEFEVPAMCPTMCAFGGPDLRTLYVTSARQERDAGELARLPQSGGIFAMQVDVPGLPESTFAG